MKGEALTKYLKDWAAEHLLEVLDHEIDALSVSRTLTLSESEVKALRDGRNEIAACLGLTRRELWG